MYFCSQKCFCIQHFYQVIFKINILIRTNIDGKTDSALLDFCKNEQIQVEVYFPIAHREALKNSVITKMAAKYGVSAAQLCIRYGLQLGTIALPKTANPEHMKNNADIDFVITDGDFQTLLQMEELRDYGAYNIFPVFSGKPLV